MTEPSAPRRIAQDLFKGAVLFVALGPALGSLTIVTMFAIIGGADTTLGEQASGALVLYAISLLFAYPLGAVPALLTGLCAGRFRDRLRSPFGLLAIGATGALLSSGWAWLALDSGKFGVDGPFMAAAGGLATVCCAWVFGKRRWSGPTVPVQET